MTCCVRLEISNENTEGELFIFAKATFGTMTYTIRSARACWPHVTTMQLEPSSGSDGFYDTMAL